MMEYQGYIGIVEFDGEAELFHGEVINTRDVITFQGKSVHELKQAFHASVDDYLAFCQERGEEPDRPFSGQFMTRMPPELHRQVNLAARLAGKSINAWVSEQLQNAVAQTKQTKAAPSVKTNRRVRSAAGKSLGKRKTSRKSQTA